MTKVKSKPELTSERYRELMELRKNLRFDPLADYKDSKDNDNTEIEKIDVELRLYTQAAEDHAKMLLEIPSFKTNLLHGINRLSNQKFQELNFTLNQNEIKAKTETQNYLGDLNNFIRTLQVTIEGDVPIDPAYQRHHMLFYVHISYKHTNGGSNGCNAETSLYVDFRNIGTYKCNMYSAQETDVTVHLGKK